MMEKYPVPIEELETIQHILDTGCSISRFGDGEVKLMDGAAQIREPANAALAAELRMVIASNEPNHIVGIPTLNPNSPKHRNWVGRSSRFLKYLEPSKQYYSAFISRPDSAPWISSQQYAMKVRDIWMRKKTAIICQRDNKLFKVVSKTASNGFKQFECPFSQTYNVIDELELDMVRGRFECVILSCGPAATCLSLRLARKGIQAIDLGSIGGFLLKLLEMEPLGDLRTVSLRRPEGMTVDEMEAKLHKDWDVFYFDHKER